jgi:DNA-binding winged helix-turn-helix (wHTH) protein
MNALVLRNDLHREIAALREHNELLVEQVRQLNDLLAPGLVFPRVWKLTRQERACVGSLYASQSGFRTKEALHSAISGDIEVETDEKLVDVIIHKVRKKLPPGIAIDTVWGEGYSISTSGRARLAAALGHPTDPAAITAHVMEINRMSFDTIKAPVKAINGGDASVLLRGSKKGTQPRLILSLRAHFAQRCGFTIADGFNLQVGRGEKKRPSAAGPRPGRRLQAQTAEERRAHLRLRPHRAVRNGGRAEGDGARRCHRPGHGRNRPAEMVRGSRGLMTAILIMLSVMARVSPGCPAWREQYERERWARIHNDASRPPRTRPILIKQLTTCQRPAHPFSSSTIPSLSGDSGHSARASNERGTDVQQLEKRNLAGSDCRLGGDHLEAARQTAVRTEAS